MTTTELLEALRAHLSDFALPQPASVTLTPCPHTEPATAQLARHTPAHPGSALLAWADTLTHVSAEAWRVPSGESVHLSVTGRLPGGMPIRIHTGMVFTEHGLGAGLAPGAATTPPLATPRSPLTPAQLTEVSS